MNPKTIITAALLAALCAFAGCKAEPPAGTTGVQNSAAQARLEPTDIDLMQKVRDLILPSARAAGAPVADVAHAVQALGTAQNIGGARKANTCAQTCSNGSIGQMTCTLGDGSTAWETVWFNPDTTNAALLYGYGTGASNEVDAGTADDVNGAPFGGTGDPDGISWPGSAELMACKGDGANVTTYLIVYGR